MSLKYRPMAVIGFTCLLTALLCVFVSEHLTVVAIAAGIVLFIISAAFKSFRTAVYPFFISGALILSGLLIGAAGENYRYAAAFCGDEAEITGTLIDEPTHSDNRYYYILKTDRIADEDVSVRLRLSLPNELGAEPYDTVRFKARLYELGGSNGQINLYYRSKGVYLGAYAYNIDEYKTEVIRNDSQPLGLRLLKIRREIKNRVFDKLPNEYGGVVNGLLLGDKSSLSDETVDNFRSAGVMPLFAVSGLHLSVWVLGLYRLLEISKIRKRLNSAVCIVFTLMFMAVAGFSGSVCRAGIMLIALLCGNLFFRQTDSVNSLGLAAFIMFLINPYVCADIGFLLSLTATLGIVTLYPVADRYVLSRLPANIFGAVLKPLLSLIFVSISAVTGSLPVTILFIGSVSVVTVISNFLLSYAASLCMIFGGLAAVFHGIPLVSDFAAVAAGLLAKYVINVTALISCSPLAMISTQGVFWRIGTFLCLAAAAFCVIVFKGRTLAKALCVSLSACIAVCSVSSYLYYSGLTRVFIPDIEGGVGVIAAADGEKILLGNGFDSYLAAGILCDKLDDVNLKSACLFAVPGGKMTDSDQTVSILSEYNFDSVVYSGDAVVPEILTDNAVNASDAVCEAWKGAIVRYFSGEDYSLVYCSFNEVDFLLLLSCSRDSEIPDEFASADFLVCSDTIPYSLDVSSFGGVILSCKKDTYDRIAPFVSGLGVPLISTAGSGDIEIDIRGDSVRIKTEK